MMKHYDSLRRGKENHARQCLLKIWQTVSHSFQWIIKNILKLKVDR